MNIEKQIDYIEKNLIEGEEEHLYLNYYCCSDCEIEWDDEWSCQCDDECPGCGKSYSPYESDRIY